MTTEALEVLKTAHPIDLIETLATLREWDYERRGGDELNIFVEGKQRGYHLAVHWRDDLSSLHLATIMEIHVPPAKRREMYELVGLINEHLAISIGHFDYWANDNMFLFRIPILATADGLAAFQCADLIDRAVAMCDKFFPAFQFLIWAGSSPQEAVKGCILETAGDA